MYELNIEGTFSAAHQVKGYLGDCAGIHGHTYRVQVGVRTGNLDKIGMAMDFRRIKRELARILARLDHKNLNKLPFFRRHNATAEWLAYYIYREIKKKIKAVATVKVWEGQDSSVTYCE
jgi:6-pyruvoyltetrahydropterin/6-carboxytetrahydropterin synthase